MTQKLFLTSAVAMGVVLPAIAEPTYTGTFPSTGLMEADYTYTNAATETNMGVYEGSVDAEAQYEDVLYQIAAGEYLPAGTETVINCNQPGYFCPGVSGGVNYSENNNQGLTSCSTATNGDYTLSDGTGSTSDSCYRQCSGNVTIAHATGVTGNDYYGNGADTCEPTGCVNGYHKKDAVPNLTNIIGVSEAGNGYTGNTSTGSESYSENMSNTIIANDPMAFAVDYGTNGMLVGQGRCSTRAGASNTWANNTYNSEGNIVASLTDETGQTGAQYCYCNVTGYTPNGGTLQSLSSPWVFYDVSGSNCANRCADRCAFYMHRTNSQGLAFRAAVLGAIESSPAMCEANTITINWGDTDLADVTANEAGTATYGSDIRTPVKAQTKAGKRFTGWRFSAPQQTTLP